MKYFHGVRLLSAASFLVANCLAQSPPTPQGLTIVNSTFYPGASISFKQTQICETTEGVKGYSGYVNLPSAPSEGRDYEVHSWFWFFEARHDPDEAPLSLWIQGGPGAPTSPSIVGENGPCLVLPNSRDTTLNPWSWNDHVNMLYIDQPVQTGFSYDTLARGFVNEVQSPFGVSLKNQTTNSTTLSGIFSSQNSTLAPESTMAVAPVMWHFMQTWMQDFPGYSGAKDHFSIWTESYGGHYGPTFAEYFNTQNERIATGELSSETSNVLTIDTLGLVNACIDINTQMPLYPKMAANNTYGIRVFNDSAYTESVAAIPQCLNLTNTCRDMSTSLDPQGWGNNTVVNKACFGAYEYCFAHVAREALAGTLEADVFHFDIATPTIHSFPPRWAAGYYNTAPVQQALGVPLNFTGNSATISQTFMLAGDFVKGESLAILGRLLDRGINVAMMYGDRDYQCNWFGGEAISLAIKFESASDFSQAGYADIQTNASYVGGFVRQHGNLSFSRVFQAGHEVAYYQPETAYQIFNRAMTNRDVATGQTAIHDTGNASTYSTTGRASALTSGDVPIVFEDQVQCYMWDILETCTPEQTALFANGGTVTHDFVLVGARLANGTVVGGNGTTAPPEPYRPESGAGSVLNVGPRPMMFAAILAVCWAV